MDQDIQRRLLLCNEGRQIEYLRTACQSEDGLAWCRQRFQWDQVLEWMWQERQGDWQLLSLWPLPEELAKFLQLLMPSNYDGERLAGILFPHPGSYHLHQENGWKEPHPIALSGRLAKVVCHRILEMTHFPYHLKARLTPDGCSVAPPSQGARILLRQVPLEASKAEAVGYGAKDTGEMGGGAAGALLLEAGSELQDEARRQLAKLNREIGDTFLTPAYGRLAQAGTRWVVHIVSILKHTPQGAWCPHPEKLEEGVYRALELLSEKRVESFAISALATGEGRVTPDLSARLMLGAMRKFFRLHPDSPMQVTVCLPSDRDLAAFESELARRN